MKRLAISFLMSVCLIADAKDKAIQDFILDEQTVYTIPVSGYRVTTISFPGPISAMDGAQVTIDPQKAAAFLIAHTKGSSFFSVRAEMKKATTNVNIRWNNKTYVLELIESDEPYLSVTFENAQDNSASVQAEPVTPTRLLAEAASLTEPRYQENVAALKSVQPEDLSATQIDARLGACWIPVKDFEKFASELLAADDIKVLFTAPLGTWTVQAGPLTKGSVANTTEWGTDRAAALELIEDALNHHIRQFQV